MQKVHIYYLDKNYNKRHYHKNSGLKLRLNSEIEVKNRTNFRDNFAKILKKNKITGSRKINAQSQKIKLEKITSTNLNPVDYEQTDHTN